MGNAHPYQQDLRRHTTDGVKVRYATLPYPLGTLRERERCTFGGHSIVPGVAVFQWDRIPFDCDRENLLAPISTVLFINILQAL
ncbi:hypothetical protein [Coleofasciculus sp.]|uniref:hypothetical protein n=1 Tax=Coleofasciculus sp. TaxID=3100458 RepID=UPI003A33342B